MNITNKNISNLTSLWKLINTQVGTRIEEKTFEYGSAHYSDWPNRLWFHNSPDLESITSAKKIIASSPVKLTIPYWHIYNDDSHTLLEKNGFSKVFEQTGMFLSLENYRKNSEGLKLKKVDNKESAILWEDLLQKAFKYKVSHKLLLQSYNEVDFMIAQDQNGPVGTVVLHSTSPNILGIHAMGIIPEMRGKGLAEKMMHTVLSRGLEQGMENVTLQASDMGKNLYLKLGFKEHFKMSNYILQS
ncbi:GNAT family N-acetyltransferase [Flagellimonas sp.]|uniref:GNAT family N-acetyltransferase n=1 Tax=Flagellimonas sp. TaxID=2058762 RepID=UPI003B5CEFD5